MGTLSDIVDAETPDGTGAAIGPALGASSSPGPSEVPELAPPPVGPAHPEGPGGADFGEFYAGHYADLVRLAALLSGSSDAAPDLVQDCFVRLHGHWTAVREPLPYVRRSVVHACASHHRSVARARRQPAPEVRDSMLDADELGDALAKLPTRQPGGPGPGRSRSVGLHRPLRRSDVAARPGGRLCGRPHRGGGRGRRPHRRQSERSPSIVVASPYTFLFSRVTSSGVTVRAYSAGTTTTGGCGPAVMCVPSTTVPSVPTCPAGAECAQPIVVPHTTGTASGSGTTSGGGSASGGVGPPGSPPGQPPRSVPPTSGPPSTTTGCGPLVVELSTDKAVGTGSVSLPSSTPSPNTVEVLGTGSFGTAEGAPVGWVAVWVGSGVASVQLTTGGAAGDSMAPDGGVVVLAASGDAGLADATVVGLGPTGATADSVPVGQAATPDVAGGCPAPTSTPPVSTTTTTTVPTPVPVPTSTTTTTVSGGPVPVPTDRPVTTAGG
jgi:hypothetical protein